MSKDTVWLENILLEYGIRVLDVANGKENPTLGELIETPVRAILQRLDDIKERQQEEIVEINGTKCPECGRVCTTLAGLSKHLNSVHKAQGANS